MIEQENNYNDIVVGLDIGTTKIACIVGVKNQHDKIEILGVGKTDSLGVQRGVVANIEQTIESITKAVQIASEKTNIDIKDVIVGIAGQHIKSIQRKGSITRHSLDEEVSQDDINILIDNMYRLNLPAGEEILHIHPQEYIIDGEGGIKRPIGHAGMLLEANFHIITGQVSAIKNIHKCVIKSNLSIIELNLEPLASAKAVLSEEEKEAGVVLVDIGGGTTDIAIYYDNIIRHTSVIPFGGNIITEDIKQGCNILKAQAEKLKVKFGAAIIQPNSKNEVVSIPGLRGQRNKEITFENLARIIQERMKEILELVLFEIKNSGFDNKLAAGIVITGGGAQLKYLPQLVMQTTGLDCRIGTPNEHICGSNLEELKNPLYATGIGLVLYGIEKYENENKNKKQNNANKENSKQTVEKPIDHSTVTTHTSKSKNNILETILNKTKDWFNDDI